MPEASGSREMVRSVAKTLDVIRAFDAEHRDLTLSDVARRTGQTRASARRFLLSLEALGFVRSDGQLFSLTPRVLSLGHAFLSSLRLPDVAVFLIDRDAAAADADVSVLVPETHGMTFDELQALVSVPLRRA